MAPLHAGPDRSAAADRPLRTDTRHWIQAGAEITDRATHLAAVVTRETSDRLMSAVAHRARRTVTVRASRSVGAVTLRGRIEAEPWQLFRLAPLPTTGPVRAGPVPPPTAAGGSDRPFHPHGHRRRRRPACTSQRSAEGPGNGPRRATARPYARTGNPTRCAPPGRPARQDSRTTRRHQACRTWTSPTGARSTPGTATTWAT
ncbi:DUF1349 domain-containing protein [Streptomyces antibioticus]|uniref:DUF1349 domain-containing protein n=1 Tax=Streptomyces antibioticus TaxID=1890 RepID=UPI00368B3F76